MRRTVIVVVAALSVAVTTGCTTRLAEERDATTTAPTTTLAVGTPEELLTRLVDTVDQISEAVIGSGDQDALLEEAEAVWASVRADVEATDAVAARNMQQMMDLARVAVERKRAADADKATKYLRDVVEQYLG